MAETATKAKVRLIQYEAMFLFGANAAQELQNTLNLVRGMIEKHGGEVLVLKRWDERKLAYEVEKHKRGVFILAYFKAPGSTITPLERDVRLSEHVVRVLITRADHLNLDEMNAVEPQPIQRVEERNSWDRPSGDYRESRPPRDDRGPREDRPPRDDRQPRAPRRDDVPA